MHILSAIYSYLKANEIPIDGVHELGLPVEHVRPCLTWLTMFDHSNMFRINMCIQHVSNARKVRWLIINPAKWMH